MERYNKYFVEKRSDVEKYLSFDQQLVLQNLFNLIALGRESDGKVNKNYVVVSESWPIYETVWGLLEAFVDGKPNEIESLRARVQELEAGMGEPVAWYGESDDGECHLYFDKQDMLREVLRIYTYYPLYRTPQPTKQEASEHVKPKFPTMLRKMWSGSEVQQWLDEQDLFTTPQPTPTPTVKAAVAAALRKAAELFERKFVWNDADTWWYREAAESLLAIPHDDSALREFGVKIARATYSAVPKSRMQTFQEWAEAIVDRVLGEKK